MIETYTYFAFDCLEGPRASKTIPLVLCRSGVLRVCGILPSFSNREKLIGVQLSLSAFKDSLKISITPASTTACRKVSSKFMKSKQTIVYDPIIRKYLDRGFFYFKPLF